jgi:hypothetical protein
MPATSKGLFIAAFLAALSPLAAAAQSDAGKTLRVVPHADLTVVDPQFIGVYITRNFGYLVYDTLFGMDRDFRPQPEMVDSWQISDDKLTYTFHLRDGLKFHDGQPVRAADAVASLKRWGQRNDSYGQPLLAAASAIEAIDDSQFRIVLKSRFPVLEALGTTTSPTPFILPERLAKTDAFTQITEVNGSGPFKFLKEEWQPGHKAVYVKNPDYVPRAEPPNNTAGGKVAKVDRVEWLYIATYDMLNPATNRNLRAPGPSGYSIPGWATDETIEICARHGLPPRTRRSGVTLRTKSSAALSKSPSICRSGNSSATAPSATRSTASLTLRSRCYGTSTRNNGWVRRNGYAVIPELSGVHPDFAFTGELLRPMCLLAGARNP